jgi:hypothetical protein
MDIKGILEELKTERHRLDQAITALDGVNSSGRGRKAGGARGTRRRKHHMSAAGRKRLSLMMKRRWAQGKMKGRKKAA